MDDSVLPRTSTAPDLGIKITNNQNWNAHITDIINKSYKCMWFLVRTLGYEAPIKSKLTTYLSLVRSITKYNTVVWSPITKDNIYTIEKVQKKCTNFILNNPRWPSPNHINYKARLTELNLLPLSYRREVYDLIFFH